jgi:glucose-1-phosphate adenylyltransferase
MHNVLTLILGGGRGTRLYPLTRHRSEPAVPIAGNYRLIDIPISNCLNSDFNRVYVLTQFLSVSLHRHIAQTYKFDPFSQGFVDVLPAEQTNEDSSWYKGTADALRQNIRYVQDDDARHVLVLSGDQLYRMDFRQLLQTHRDLDADVTIAVKPVTAEQARGLGVLRVDDTGRMIELVEKPTTDERLQSLKTPADWLERRALVSNGRDYLVNMGIYIFRREALFDLLNQQPDAVDLVREIFARYATTHQIRAHLFDGYWEDLGTIKTYHEANMALADEPPPFYFYEASSIMYTRMRYLPSSRVSGARLERCLVSDGCVVQPDTQLEHCILGVRSRVGRNVTVRDSVIMGATRFETDAERSSNRQRGIPDLGIGDDTVIERAIVDKDCRIGRDVRLVNQLRIQEAEGDNYAIREGILVVPSGSIVKDGTII